MFIVIKIFPIHILYLSSAAEQFFLWIYWAAFGCGKFLKISIFGHEKLFPALLLIQENNLIFLDLFATRDIMIK